MSLVIFKNKKNIDPKSILVGENKSKEEFICISNAKINKQDKIKSYEGRVATPEGPESLHLLRGCNVSV